MTIATKTKPTHKRTIALRTSRRQRRAPALRTQPRRQSAWLEQARRVRSKMPMTTDSTNLLRELRDGTDR